MNRFRIVGFVAVLLAALVGEARAGFAPWWVSGAAVTPPPTGVLTLNPTSLIFASQTLNSTSSPQTVTASNTGNASLTISSVATTGADAGDFGIINNSCMGTLAVNASCTFQVNFTPSASGTRTASAVVNSSVGSPTVTLSGTGAAALALTLSPTNVAFGSQAVATTSSPQTITASNTGNSSVTINSVATTGMNPNDFGIINNNCITTLVSNSTCTFQVNFTPSVVGSRVASVSVTSSIGTVTASLSGVGTSTSGGLPPFFIMGVQNAGPNTSGWDGCLGAHNNSIPLDICYTYVTRGFTTTTITNFMTEAQGYNETPLFSWYIDAPGSFGSVEVYVNNASNMKASFTQFVTMLQAIQSKIGSQAPGTVLAIVHVEPDFWGFIQQECACTNPHTLPAAVANSGYAGPPGFSSLPNTIAGLAQAYVLLRNAYAPTVLLGWHITQWGAGAIGVEDNYNPVINPNVNVTAGDHVGQFYNDLFASTSYHFDIGVSDVSDRDSGLNKTCALHGGTNPFGGSATNNTGLFWGLSNTGSEGGVHGINNFTNFTAFVGAFDSTTGLQTLLWQTPIGNTVMRANDDDYTIWHSGAWNFDSGKVGGGHFQDDRVQYWVQSGNPHISELKTAGIRGINFAAGQGAGISQCAIGGLSMSSTWELNSMGDGIYNPAPTGFIDNNAAGIFPGNTTNDGVATIAADDGGFFYQQVKQYYTNGRVPFP